MANQRQQQTQEIAVYAAGHPTYDVLERAVSENKELIEAGLGINPRVLLRAGINALIRTPKMSECSAESLYIALLRCAETSLMPDGDEAAIVPRWNSTKKITEAGFMPMINGKRKQVRAANPGCELRSALIYKDDSFAYILGSDPSLEHKPNLLGDRTRDAIIGVYATFKAAEGGTLEIEVMSTLDVEAVRKAYSSDKSTAWTKSWTEMARKTVEGRLFKRLPKRAIDYRDNDLDEIEMEEEAPQQAQPIRQAGTAEQQDRATDAEVEGEEQEEEKPPPKARPRNGRRRAAKDKEEPKPEPEPDKEPEGQPKEGEGPQDDGDHPAGEAMEEAKPDGDDPPPPSDGDLWGNK